LISAIDLVLEHRILLISAIVLELRPRYSQVAQNPRYVCWHNQAASLGCTKLTLPLQMAFDVRRLNPAAASALSKVWEMCVCGSAARDGSLVANRYGRLDLCKGGFEIGRGDWSFHLLCARQITTESPLCSHGASWPTLAQTDLANLGWREPGDSTPHGHHRRVATDLTAGVVSARHTTTPHRMRKWRWW
jgi:hypothetical protein